MEFRYDFIISLDTVSGFEITFEKWCAKIFASEPRYSKVSIAGGVSDQALQPPSPPPTLPGKVKGWILWKLWSFLVKII